MSVLSIFIGIQFTKDARNWWYSCLAFLLFAYSSAVALLGAVTTNTNPSKGEGIALKTGYNFVRNWKVFLLKDDSGSFAYNSFFHYAISLKGYFFLLYIILLIIGAIVFFVLPRRNYES